jgi:hypothetical protein
MDKPKFHITRESFDSSEFGFYIDGETMLIKSDGKTSEMKISDEGYVFSDDELTVAIDENSYEVKEIVTNNISTLREMDYIAEYMYLFKNMSVCAPFAQAE